METTPRVPGQITGREPRLSVNHSQVSGRRLSLRGLATMLNTLPPEAISLEAAAAALRNEAFFVRYSAAQVLAKRGDRDARIVLTTALNDNDARTRAIAARHLGSFSWFSVESLLRQALTDADSRVREGAVYALCEMGQFGAYALLAEALRKDTDNVRAAAAWGLRETQDPAAVLALEAVLLADDASVRVQSLEALGANGTPQAIPVTQRALYDPDPEVKYAATLSLLELIGEDALPELAALIKETRGDVRASVLRGLFHATNYLGIDVAQHETHDMVVDALKAALQDELPETRIAAIWPLAWIRTDRAQSALWVGYLDEPDAEVKAHFVHLAASLMTRNADEIVADALRSTEELVRATAEQIMSQRATGPVARYDDTDTQRHGLSTPSLTDDED